MAKVVSSLFAICFSAAHLRGELYCTVCRASEGSQYDHILAMGFINQLFLGGVGNWPNKYRKVGYGEAHTDRPLRDDAYLIDRKAFVIACSTSNHQ